MKLPLISRPRLLWTLGFGALGALALWLVMRPETIEVDLAAVDRGPLRVTIDEDGVTRVTDRHIISSPLTGQLQRIALEAGDAIARDEVIARLSPLPLDTRMQQEAADQLAAAEATARAAGARIKRAQAEHLHARTTRARLEQVEAEAPGAIARQRLDEARTAEQAAGAAVEEARQAATAADRQVDAARARLLGSVGPPSATAEADGDVAHRTFVTSPATGHVLRVYEPDARVVAAGTPLIEVADASQLEIIADVLTDDATRLTPGSPALVSVPGSPDTLPGLITLIEPSAFTRISPLGVEEQRVNVIVRLDEVEGSRWLGDRYRVSVGLVAWQAEEVVRVPVSALCRAGERWAVWHVVEGQALQTPIEIGHRNRVHAEVVAGLEPGATVVVYPPESLRDGARVRPIGGGGR